MSLAHRLGFDEDDGADAEENLAVPAGSELLAALQREYRRAALEQPEHEVLKPRVRLSLAERGEPHLPVEPRLVRRDERSAGVNAGCGCGPTPD